MAELIPGVRNSARALIVRDHHLLLLQKQQGLLALPGGGQETGETLIDALQRECAEEIGCPVNSPVLVGVADYVKLKRGEPPMRRHQVECLFRCDVPADYVAHNGPSPDKRQLDVVWYPLEALPNAAFSPFYLHQVVPALIAAPGSAAVPVYLGAFHDEPGVFHDETMS